MAVALDPGRVESGGAMAAHASEHAVEKALFAAAMR